MHFYGRGMLFAGLLLVTLQAGASPELARKKYCMTCHGFGQMLVGPGYPVIAARRAGEADGEETIVNSILHGSKGQWGKLEMPGNAVTEEEARTLARWILSLAKDTERAQEPSTAKSGPDGD